MSLDDYKKCTAQIIDAKVAFWDIWNSEADSDLILPSVQPCGDDNIRALYETRLVDTFKAAGLQLLSRSTLVRIQQVVDSAIINQRLDTQHYETATNNFRPFLKQDRYSRITNFFEKHGRSEVTIHTAPPDAHALQLTIDLVRAVDMLGESGLEKVPKFWRDLKAQLILESVENHQSLPDYIQMSHVISGKVLCP